MTLPAPLTPPDCDLRDFPRMMVHIPRLFGSQFNALASRQPIAWMVGFKLWCRAFHQVPGGSLPADDESLAHLAELGFDVKTLRRVRPVALRGWTASADGLLYHPVVAEVVLDAWIEKLLQQRSSLAGNAKRYHHAFDPGEIDAAIERASHLLAALNPRARACDKLRRRQSRSAPDDLPPTSHRPPTGSGKPPTGSPTGTPPGLPHGSQGTGKGERREEESVVVGRGRERADPPDGNVAVVQFGDEGDWPRGDVHAWAKALTACAGPGLLDETQASGLVDQRVEIARWKTAGASWALDVVPTVQSLSRSGRKRIAGWSYFTRAVLQALANRRAPLTLPEPDHGLAPPHSPARERHERNVASLHRVADELRAQGYAAGLHGSD